MSTSDGTPSDPPPAPAWRTRLTAAAAWMRAHSTHALAVGITVAVVGGTVPAIATGLWDEWFGDRPPQCPGSGCDGKNPQKEGCSADAATWQPEGTNPASLHLRYSKHCGAVWARIVTGEKGDGVTVQVRGGSSQSAVVESNHDNFTPMAAVGTSFHIKACAVPTVSLARTGQWDKYCIKATEKAPWKED